MKWGRHHLGPKEKCLLMEKILKHVLPHLGKFSNLLFGL